MRFSPWQTTPTHREMIGPVPIRRGRPTAHRWRTGCSTLEESKGVERWKKGGVLLKKVFSPRQTVFPMHRERHLSLIKGSPSGSDERTGEVTRGVRTNYSDVIFFRVQTSLWEFLSASKTPFDANISFSKTPKRMTDVLGRTDLCRAEERSPLKRAKGHRPPKTHEMQNNGRLKWKEIFGGPSVAHAAAAALRRSLRNHFNVYVYVPFRGAHLQWRVHAQRVRTCALEKV